MKGKMKGKLPSRRNPMAGLLSNAAAQQKIVSPLKGRGAYKRKPKHPDGAFGED